MEGTAEGVEKNCLGCKGRHGYPFGQYCEMLAASAGADARADDMAAQ